MVVRGKVLEKASYCALGNLNNVSSGTETVIDNRKIKEFFKQTLSILL